VGGGFQPVKPDIKNEGLVIPPLPANMNVVTSHNSAAGQLPDLTGKTRPEADKALTDAGFKHTGTSAGGYENYQHPDGSRVYIRPNGEVIRTPPPEYAADGSRSNKGARVGPDGEPTDKHNTGEILKND
jgi:hypothetical protein